MSPLVQVLLFSVLAFMAVAGVGFAFAGGGGRLDQRVKEIGGATQPTSRQKKQADPNQARRRAVSEQLKGLERAERERRANLFTVKSQLVQANIAMTEATYWIMSLVVGAMLGAVVFLLTKNPLFAIGAFAGGGLVIPRWTLGFIIGGRQKKFTLQFADGIDIIVRGVKSGLPLNECLRIIARESPEPLRSEFQLVVDNTQMGVSMDTALAKLYDRMPLPEINFFNIVLGIQAKAGGNLSEALGNLSAVIRSRRMLREKIKALSSEAKASAMIIGCLPPAVMIMTYFAQRDYIMLLFTDKLGHLFLMGCVALMSTGIIVMRNMINFKF
jgi:tight adherence protein B